MFCTNQPKMTPGATTHLFKEAYDTFPSKGNQPTTTYSPSGGHVFLSSWSSPTTNCREPIPLWPSSLRPPSTKPTMATKILSVPNASLSTILQLLTTPRQSSKFVQRRPTNSTSTFLPIRMRPNVAPPNSCLMSLTRSGTTILKTQTFSTQRSRPLTSWPSLTPTAEGYMPSI